MLMIVFSEQEGSEWRVVRGSSDEKTVAMFEKGYFDDPSQRNRRVFFNTKMLVTEVDASLYRVLETTEDCQHAMEEIEVPTGVGIKMIQRCKKCDFEVDITNYDNW